LCPAPTDDTDSAAAVAIFDSATGRLERSIPLGPLMRAAAVRGGANHEHVAYSGLGWSPDGQHVAVVFTDFGDRSAAPENVLDSGLLLLDVAAGTHSIMRGDSGFFAAASGVSDGFPVWHLGQQVVLPAFLPESGLAYAWSMDGAPYPILPLHDALDQLPINAGPRYPVGAPDGGPRFTIWQPGLEIGSGGGADAGQATFVSAFPAWSPDGSNLTLLVAGVALRAASIGGQMGGSTTMRQELQAAALMPPLPSPPVLPLVPPRDAALAAVQVEVGNVGWAVVGWNPSGSLLASINCVAPSDQRMELRDTATAQVLASDHLNLAAGDPGCRGSPNATVVGGYPSLGLSLAWSPVGSQVLLCDRAGNALTLYQIRSPSGN
jgi:hypothetical protein